DMSIIDDLSNAILERRAPYLHELNIEATGYEDRFKSERQAVLDYNKDRYREAARSAIAVLVASRVALLGDAGREDESRPWLPPEIRKLVIQYLAPDLVAEEDGEDEAE